MDGGQLLPHDAGERIDGVLQPKRRVVSERHVRNRIQDDVLRVALRHLSWSVGRQAREYTYNNT